MEKVSTTTTSALSFLEQFMSSKIVLTLASNGVLATFGAIANYIYLSAKKSQPMRFMPFMMTAFLGFFVGNVVGNFIPPDFAYRDGTMLVTGFCFYPILSVLENKIPQIFAKKLDQAFDVNDKAEKK